MKNTLTAILLVGTLVTSYAQKISAEQIQKHIYFLASDELKGRGTATDDEKKAADYIAKKFKEYKLEPIGGNNSYFYTFNFKKKKSPHDTATSDMPELKGTNVVGFLNKKAAKTIVIGAHYDHLGLGHDHNSLDPIPEGKIHNGADDNASGTSGVLELARYFSSSKFNAYNILFICFSGEELGLLGSKKWTEKPSYPMEKIYYMINMDMIGRLNDSTKKIVIYGVGTSNHWVPIIDSLGKLSSFSIKKDSAGVGPSDQTSFYLQDKPVLHFFTGQHSDYHKPSDDADKINYKGEVAVLEFIVKVIESTAKQSEMKFQKTASSQENKVSFKVTMGIMPDYTFEGKGVKIDGVTPNKPADKAGLQKNDIITKLGEYPVNNVQDYMKALSKFNKGDTTDVTINRNGKEVVLKVTF